GGAGRGGAQPSACGDAHSMSDSNAQELFSDGAGSLGQRGIAFILTREALGEASLTAEIRRQFGGPVIVNENYDIATARSMVAQGQADAVAFGKAFIANPDLVARLKTNAPLNDWDRSTLYTAGAKGYIDYPPLASMASPQKETCS